MQGHNSRHPAFTLIVLLVVIAVIVLALHKVRFRAHAMSCLSNLWQMNLALAGYAHDDTRNRLPLEPTEHNPHPGPLAKLGADPNTGLAESFYCPRRACSSRAPTTAKAASSRTAARVAPPRAA